MLAAGIGLAVATGAILVGVIIFMLVYMIITVEDLVHKPNYKYWKSVGGMFANVLVPAGIAWGIAAVICFFAFLGNLIWVLTNGGIPA